ncbi:PIN domain-containing protein [Thiomicrospira sp. ALE5]|uniref:PIN domain-containing protein n=1 Tax=Thiomicrospira sp. ALE5 TaxID=748650 RepID=UPI0008EA10FA|nr:PIN domain-containing protein [Thiomicrospira sp. ALE5]SFR60215.1 Predicted nucleic acid-binding protein, contains PIN domain [Thiomicrospira sp. ALE5]
MSAKAFLDTNILIYALDQDQIKKQCAMHLIAQGHHISIQVLNEFASVCFKKLKLQPNQILSIIDLLERMADILDFNTQTIRHAIELKQRYKLQYYDSLIVATALGAKCDTLYSEDLQHGLIIDNQLQVINPFRLD